MEADLKAARAKCKGGKKFLKLQVEVETATSGGDLGEVMGLEDEERKMDKENAGLKMAIQKVRDGCMDKDAPIFTVNGKKMAGKDLSVEQQHTLRVE